MLKHFTAAIPWVMDGSLPGCFRPGLPWIFDRPSRRGHPWIAAVRPAHQCQRKVSPASLQLPHRIRLRAFVFSTCCFIREHTVNPARAPSNSHTEVRLCAFVFSSWCFIREFTVNPAGAPSNSHTEVRLCAFVFSICCFIREFSVNPAGAPSNSQHPWGYTA